MSNLADFLTVAEVALLLRLHPTTIYRWEKRGISPVTPIRLVRTRQLRYPEDAVETLRAFKEETEVAVIGRQQ